MTSFVSRVCRSAIDVTLTIGSLFLLSVLSLEPKRETTDLADYYTACSTPVKSPRGSYTHLSSAAAADGSDLLLDELIKGGILK